MKKVADVVDLSSVLHGGGGGIEMTEYSNGQIIPQPYNTPWNSCPVRTVKFREVLDD